MSTKITQTRTAVLVDGVTNYRITTNVIEKGTLPDLGLFLMRITDTEDPLQDTFERIVGVADFTIYKSSRSGALQSNEVLFRSPEFIKTYNDLTTAVTAAKIVKDRVNDLHAAWNTYYNDFVVDTEHTLFPMVDPTTLTKLINEYIAAKTALEAAQAARAAADAALLKATGDASAAKATLDTLLAIQEDISALESKIAALEPLVTALTTLGTAVGRLPSTGLLADLNDGTSFLKALALFMKIVYNDAVIYLDGRTAGTAESLENSRTDIASAVDRIVTGFNTFLADIYSPQYLHNVCNAQTGVGSPLEAAGAELNKDIDTSDVDGAVTTAQAEDVQTTADLRDTAIDAEVKDAQEEQAQAAADDALAAVQAICPNVDPDSPEDSLP